MENSSPSKSVWKFHGEDQKKRKHSSEGQKLSFSLELCSDDEEPPEKSTRVDAPSSGSESTPKKKKTSVVDKDLMPQVLNDMEEEIERQLDSKAEKTNLTVINVKNILKSVITNEDVMAMVRQSLHDQNEGLDVKCIYEPKLTRAKTKELLKLQPLSSNLWPIPPVTHSPLKSECHVLIQQELPEDSSDEEYNPNEDYQSDEDDEKNASSVASDVDSSPATPLSSTANISVDESTTVWSHDGMFKIPPENIGQRTRSKLCLSDTPLEAIEQAFIPPDITTDMYEWGCDNDDWKNFLQEFSKPLDSEPAVVDDPEEDPEYNVLADEEEEIVDKEELRMDRAVKVSRKELNELMSELFDYTENVMHQASDDEDESSKPGKSETDTRTIFDGSNLQCSTVSSSAVQDQPTIYQQPVNVPVSLNSCFIMENTCFPQPSPAPLRSAVPPDINRTPQIPFSSSNLKGNVFRLENKPTECGVSKDLVPASAVPNQMLPPIPNRALYTPNNKTFSGKNAYSPLDLNELCNSSEAFLSIDKDRTPAKEHVSTEVGVAQTAQEVGASERIGAVEVRAGWSLCTEQLLLLNQQMRQHVQLTAQHFLQTYRHPDLSHLGDQCKNMLMELKARGKESNLSNSAFNAMNLKSALSVVKAWESLFEVPAVEKSIKSFVGKMYSKYCNKQRRVGRNEVPEDLLFPPPLLEVVAASKAFLYPLLLPPVPFFNRGVKFIRPNFSDSEERLIAYGLDSYVEVVKNRKSKFSEKEKEWDILPLIVNNYLPVGEVASLKNYIMRKRYTRERNPIKDYYQLKKLPQLVHYVIPIEDGKTLLQQPLDLLPEIWKNFVLLKQRKSAKNSLLS